MDAVAVDVLLAAFAQESGEPLPEHWEQHAIIPVNRQAEGCRCNTVYECQACGTRCGWCFGASDGMPAVCDDCWCRYEGAA